MALARVAANSRSWLALPLNLPPAKQPGSARARLLLVDLAKKIAVLGLYLVALLDQLGSLLDLLGSLLVDALAHLGERLDDLVVEHVDPAGVAEGLVEQHLRLLRDRLAVFFGPCHQTSVQRRA
jgi:hypothetical protein